MIKEYRLISFRPAFGKTIEVWRGDNKQMSTQELFQEIERNIKREKENWNILFYRVEIRHKSDWETPSNWRKA